VTGEGVIRRTLDLLIRLQDTTTGLSVDERNVLFTLGGKEIRPTSRGFGNFILVNYGRENGLMQVNVYGYEPFSVYVDYEALDEVLPTVDIFLIPSENDASESDMLSLTGKLKGISALECIHPGRPLSGVREFEPKKRIMTIYAPNRRMNMVHSFYGLFHSEEDTYENIEITEQIESNKVRLRKPLEEEFTVNAPICRRIFGRVDEDGNYLLRVRDDGKRQVYLVKYIVDGETRYKSVNFHDLAGVALD